MFSKWWLMKRSLYVRDPDEPPPIIEDCHNIQECYRWRETIMKDIGDKLAEIQNAGLGEFRIRALNDELNKLLNFKRMWEARIRELGGPDFTAKEAKFRDSEGLLLPGSGGYMYFGAAKDLPGVRELFFRPPPAAPRSDARQLDARVSAGYFLAPEIDSWTLEELDKMAMVARAEKGKEWARENFAQLKKKYAGFEGMGQLEVEEILRREELDRKEEKKEVEVDKELEKRKRMLIERFVKGKIEEEPKEEAQQIQIESDDIYKYY